MSTFTPGPWHVEPTNSAKESYVVCPDEQGANGGSVVIGQCRGPFMEGNARLIAAAPDLLAALKMLDERGHTQATWDFAKRALAKAGA
jgi:hypothetical protein